MDPSTRWHESVAEQLRLLEGDAEARAAGAETGCDSSQPAVAVHPCRSSQTSHRVTVGTRGLTPRTSGRLAVWWFPWTQHVIAWHQVANTVTHEDSVHIW